MICSFEYNIIGRASSLLLNSPLFFYFLRIPNFVLQPCLLLISPQLLKPFARHNPIPKTIKGNEKHLCNASHKTQILLQLRIKNQKEPEVFQFDFRYLVKLLKISKEILKKHYVQGSSTLMYFRIAILSYGKKTFPRPIYIYESKFATRWLKLLFVQE